MLVLVQAKIGMIHAGLRDELLCSNLFQFGVADSLKGCSDIHMYFTLECGVPFGKSVVYT